MVKKYTKFIFFFFLIILISSVSIAKPHKQIKEYNIYKDKEKDKISKKKEIINQKTKKVIA